MATERKRYLIIAAKPSAAKNIRDAYVSIGDDAKFDADIVPANNCVINVNDRLLVHDDNREELMAMDVLKLKDRDIDLNFRVVTEEPWNKFGNRITHLVNTNQYDAIVNACDQNEEGELMFQYTIESLGLDRFETKRLPIGSFVGSDVVIGLMVLNDY